jgi:glutathione S-transferase
VLSSRASYGGAAGVVDGDSPLGPLMPYCPHCMRIGLLMAEAGVPFETYMIDGQDKPAWFLDAFPAGTTPAMQGVPGGLAGSDEWVGDFDVIMSRAKEQSPRFAAVASERGPLTTKQAADLVTRTAYAQFAGVMVGTQLDSGKGMMGALMRQGRIETIEGEGDAALLARIIQITADGLAEVERVLSALPGPFLGGDSPAEPDAFMATMLFWCHNALECGLSVLPQAPCTLADVGAPSALRYLQAGRCRLTLSNPR